MLCLLGAVTEAQLYKNHVQSSKHTQHKKQVYNETNNVNVWTSLVMLGQLTEQQTNVIFNTGFWFKRACSGFKYAFDYAY